RVFSHLWCGSHLLLLVIDRLGADITLFLTHPEMVEGGVSVESSTPSWNVRHSLLVHDPGAEPPHAGPRLLLDFLNRQKKLRGRSRKSSARGCFGMKVDRIGALSGMGSFIRNPKCRES
uniref:Uncharacterized protein n=1 Tax=Electrophorus electricus TaxID=8005 RepID=A0A4W4FG94_ELEEL